MKPTLSHVVPLLACSVSALALAACQQKTPADATPSQPPATEAAAPAAAPGSEAATSAFMPIEMDMKQKMSAAVGPSVEHTWAVKMLAHHQGGIEMSEALLKRSPNGPMRDMAQKTVEKQRKDSAELQNWVQAHEGHGGGSVNPFAHMEEQMSQRMMAATGGTPDEAWTRKMIEHHQGAVDMSKRVLADAKDPDLRRMAQKTIDMQSRDIEALRAKLAGGCC
jgi:uncharacterized protein (DUF305 family)